MSTSSSGTGVSGPAPTPSDRPWQNTALPAEKRADLLLQAMTLEEKVAQLGSRWLGGALPDDEDGSGQPPSADGDAAEVAADPAAAELGHLLRQAHLRQQSVHPVADRKRRILPRPGGKLRRSSGFQLLHTRLLVRATLLQFRNISESQPAP